MSMILSSRNFTFSLKVAVVSTCVLLVGVVLKLSVPSFSGFVASHVPSFWNVMLRWLKPPYLYIVINGIIISIVAFSKLQHKDDDHDLSPEAASMASEKVVVREFRSGYGLVYDPVRDLSGNILTVEDEGVYARVEENKVVGDERVNMDGGEVEKHVIAPQRSDSMEFYLDSSNKEKEKEKEGKPPVSARFGHRKAVKASPEGGKALRVSKPRRNDTLESTWKTITEGRAMPLTRHLKKADTCEHVRQHNTPPPAPKMKKSETFAEATTTDTNTSNNSNGNGSGNSSRLRREPSPSQDELNRRVEAFIKKFNEEMRLQRQRSLEQYNQMISRGAN